MHRQNAERSLRDCTQAASDQFVPVVIHTVQTSGFILVPPHEDIKNVQISIKGATSCPSPLLQPRCHGIERIQRFASLAGYECINSTQ